MAGTYDALDELVTQLVSASWKERDPIKARLEELAAGFPDRKSVLEHLESAKRSIQDLEVRWEVAEGIEKAMSKHNKSP